MKSPLLLLGLAVVILSCSPEDPAPDEGDFFIRFKVDGQLYEYEASAHPAVFFYDQSSSIYQGAILVVKPGSDGSRDFINIIVRNETEIEQGVQFEMQDAITVNSVQIARIALTWANPQGNVYNAVLLKSMYPPSMTIPNDAQVRFTEISDQVIRGEFSGIVIGPNPAVSTNPQFQITEGVFRLKKGTTN